ncbi:TadE family type IV pilus minor pilin [Streptomyces sp. TS71-3]|uniref:TadE family type IV pilus minor pilin n=1 Tax=Streptomyces sp. TS71-3 TaxID=2733862 RepID=UPI001B0265D9|nr:TadE family type IV pilus minor pilin [Streptomyces sp. TS71-3]GHJ34608.1 hypothetical protein Sm713_02170 [Streptomyces sp. TS71-3]
MGGAAGTGGRDRTGATARTGAAPSGPSRPTVTRRSDAGSVSAEAAVVLPALVLFVMGLVWALLVAAAQIQCVDAARAGARVAARQDPDAAAVAAAEQAAPKGAQVTVRREGDLVRVRVDADSPGPGALVLHLHQEAVALAEETVGAGAS